MTEIVVRVATSDDLDLLSDLIAASYMTHDDGSYDRANLAAAMPTISKANPKLLASGTYFVAEIGGEPVGCGGWTFDRPGSGEIVDGVAHIRHFATHPDHKRKGVAKVLLERCLADAAAAGVHLMKSQSTLPAEPFYAAAGFQRVRPIEVESGPGVMLPAIEMERVLP
jgi:GNAT superfamily N-acetyltransferase